MSSKKTFEMVLTALFTAIIIIMAFVPYLGYINLVVIKATLIQGWIFRIRIWMYQSYQQYV